MDVWIGDATGVISTLGVGEGRLQELRKKSIAKQVNDPNRSEDFFNIKTLRWDYWYGQQLGQFTNCPNYTQPQAKWNIHNQGLCTTSATMLAARLAVLREVANRSNLRKEEICATLGVLVAARNKRRARPLDGGLC
jgi:hypothetical protein